MRVEFYFSFLEMTLHIWKQEQSGYSFLFG
jgi:hypothetical protein